MGRVQLSTQYGIDLPSSRPSSTSPQGKTYPEPPRFMDAPFDLDAEIDAPDAVYEAFLSSSEADELRFHHLREPQLADHRQAMMASPVEYVESSSSEESAPSTRVASPIRAEDRSTSPASASAANDRGLRVLELLEPLHEARAAALPDIQAAMLAARPPVDIYALVFRLTTILRPHITSALAPFIALPDVPEVEFLGHMFERSLLLDILTNDTTSPLSAARNASGVFPRVEVQAALDAAEEAYAITSVRRERSPSRARLEVDHEAESSDNEYDPSMIEDSTMTMSITSATSTSSIIEPSASNTSYDAEVQQWLDARHPSDLQWTRPTSRPSPALQRAQQHLMDVDSEDESRSSSSGRSLSRTSYRVASPGAGTYSFAPRVFRASDSIRTRSAAVVSPRNFYRASEPLR